MRRRKSGKWRMCKKRNDKKMRVKIKGRMREGRAGRQ